MGEIGATDAKSQIDLSTQEIKYDSTRLDVLWKERDILRLSIEPSQEMMENKIEKTEGKVN